MATAASTAASMPPPSGGRPRDSRIDDAVLLATADLLEEVGYIRLTIAAIAERAGTNKPAIYRRWPTKALLVHEAVFSTGGPDVSIPTGDDLRSEIRAVVTIGVELLGRPAARAALPGLMAEMSDGTGLGEVIGRLATGRWGWLQQRIDAAIEAGEVRADVQSPTVLELVAGSTFIATAMRPTNDIDDGWIDRVTDIIMLGIAA